MTIESGQQQHAAAPYCTARAISRSSNSISNPLEGGRTACPPEDFRATDFRARLDFRIELLVGFHFSNISHRARISQFFINCEELGINPLSFITKRTAVFLTKIKLTFKIICGIVKYTKIVSCLIFLKMRRSQFNNEEATTQFNLVDTHFC
jgi:hypothetical protein